MISQAESETIQEVAKEVVKARDNVLSSARRVVMGDGVKLDLRAAVREMIEAEAELASLIEGTL